MWNHFWAIQLLKREELDMSKNNLDKAFFFLFWWGNLEVTSNFDSSPCVDEAMESLKMKEKEYL